MLDASLDSDLPSTNGLVGKTFGQYHILSLIQRGGMGEIYLASLEPQKIKVVLKRLQDTHTEDERYVEMFQNEAAVMSGLEHPNIVKVLGVPIIESKQCLVMEFVKGRNLQQFLSRLRKIGRRLSPPLGVYIMRKVLLGLYEAHHARFPDGRLLELVHRDVKPANILISFAGDVKITDFGIAKSIMQNRMTTAGVVKGTVRYLSPEQIRSDKITFRSDLFSCASVLVEMLIDKPLYDRGPVAPTLMAILNDERAPVAELLPFRAPELSECLERALSSQPEQRYSSALEFAQALGAAARALGPPVSDDDVGALLRQLFQGFSLDEHRPAEDVTYLLENDAISGHAVERTPTPRGATPLEARSFSGTHPRPEASRTHTRRKPTPPPLPQDTGRVAAGLLQSISSVDIKGEYPSEYLAAERRARSMLENDVVIETPIEAVEELLDSQPKVVARPPSNRRVSQLASIRTKTLRPGSFSVVEKASRQAAMTHVSELEPLPSQIDPKSALLPTSTIKSDAKLRLHVLLGCLAGVILTGLILAIMHWSFD